MKARSLTVLVLFLTLTLVFSACSKGAESDATEAKPDFDSETFVFADYGTIRTLDPATCYDNVGMQKILNIYETLIFFDGESTDKYVPVLATQVPTLENGGVSADGKTYTFEIREGVKFHNGAELTPEDVAYTFKRNMILDQDGGPMWMLLEALTGEGGTRDGDGNIIPGIFEKIDKSVEVVGNKVVFHLPIPYPPFISLLWYSAGAIINKEWAIENGCWDGVLANAADYNNPGFGEEPLTKIENGTGPYTMKSWEPSKEFVFERFEGYWGDKPKIKTAIFKNVNEWSTRKLMLQNGDADRVQVDNAYVPDVKEMEGLTIYEVPLLDISCALFNQKVSTQANPNIGSGKLDGNGIPPDFFADINVRKAFLHSFDRETYKREVFNDLVIMPTSPNVEGLPYHKDAPVYDYNPDKAKEYLQKAFDGEIWEKGFKMIISYNTGNEQREAAATMIAENIMALNPKFQIEIRNVDWKDYLVKYRNYMYPMFLIGWGADYPDPHNFIYTFMSSQGVYGRYMAYKNEKVDQLTDLGIKTVDPEKRREIYSELQDLWYEEALGIPIYQNVAVRAYKDYVYGYEPNPIFSTAWENLKSIYKQ